MEKVIFESIEDLETIIRSRMQLPNHLTIFISHICIWMNPKEDPNFETIEDLINVAKYFADIATHFTGVAFFKDTIWELSKKQNEGGLT